MLWCELCQPAAIRTLGAEPASEPAAIAATRKSKQPAAAAVAAAAAAGVKRGRDGAKCECADVKREHSVCGNKEKDDRPGVSRSATAAERVDLTEQVRAGVVLCAHCASCLRSTGIVAGPRRWSAAENNFPMACSQP